MKIIKEQGVDYNYSREFEWPGQRGCGFSFPCDKSGNLFPLEPAAAENYSSCTDGTYKINDLGIRKYGFKTPAIGICDDCGLEVELIGFTNTCACGADYNKWGSYLAPREQWGWDTGETVEEILSVDRY